MAFKFWNFFQPKSGKTAIIEANCGELINAAQEFQVRNLSFNICVNMIANAIGKCEFKTYEEGKEVKGSEYYTWNIEPNLNQNSTVFIHKLITRLLTDNEALIVDTKRKDGGENLFVADEYSIDDNVTRPQEYKEIKIGDLRLNKTIKESDALHFNLNHINIKPVLDGLYSSYWRLGIAAMNAYVWDNGQHWKVHISQLAQGGEDWVDKFQNMIEAQLKPFFNSSGAILPEFDGYKYEKVGGTNGNSAAKDTRDIRKLIDDIFDFTARTLLIPAVLVNGQIEGTSDANSRFLTYCIDPICDQLSEEITRKRYGYSEWQAGNFLRVDSSSIIHFDMFANAANVEKLVGSGAFTINDVRRAANQTEINEDWANNFFMTKNIATMSEIVREQS